MAQNSGALLDQDGDASDWIEIQNTGPSAVNLAGWFLTDSIGDPDKWTFPSTTLNAGSFLVVFASGKNRAVSGQQLHTNFALDDAGEYLALVAPDLTVVSEFSPVYPPQYEGVSFGLQTHGTPPDRLYVPDRGYHIQPTPGAGTSIEPAPHPLYSDASLARVDLYLSEASWNGLHSGDAYTATEERPVTLRFRHGAIDRTVSNATIRARGNTSLLKMPRSYTVSLDGLVPDQRLFNMEKLNFNADANDPSTARGKLIEDITLAAGLPAPYANHAAIVVHFTTGSQAVFFDSVLTHMQALDDQFLRLQLGTAQGNLYKCNYRQWPADLTYRGDTGSAYIGNGSTYELKYQGGEDASYNDLADFIALVTQTSAANFPTEILRVFEVDAFLQRLAIDVMTGNWDSYWGNANNYYLFHNLASGRWVYLPYDFDNAFGITWDGTDWANRNIYALGSTNVGLRPLVARILAVPAFRERYSFYVNRLIQEVIPTAPFNASAYHIRDVLTSALPFGAPSVSNVKEKERDRYENEWPYWIYPQFYYSFDFEQDYNVPAKYGLTEFNNVRRASALNQLQLVNIAPILTPLTVEPPLPRPTDPVRLSLHVFDDQNAIGAVTARYRFNGGALQSAPLAQEGGGVYAVVLPAFASTGTVSVYIEASDTGGRTTYEPFGGATHPRAVEIGSPALSLKLTELNYHPHAPTATEAAVRPDPEDYEFIEFFNSGASPLNLSGFTLSDGVTFTFPAYTLQPGSYGLVVRDPIALQTRYGSGLPVIGAFSGRLSNSGETLLLRDATGATVLSLTYSDGGDWPGRADGDGSTLELRDLQRPYANPSSWRSSSEFGGTPGAAGLGPDNRVVINEVLTHTDPPLDDRIELFNTTESAIDVGGWFLSDSASNYRKYRIPTGTVLPSGGYLVFTEGLHFNTSGGVNTNDFALDAAHGEDVFLLEAEADLTLVRFVDRVEFPATANAEAFGRWPNGAGPLYPMVSRTFGSANSGPRVGPVVISEIMYNPASGNQDLEFVEIHNPGPAAENLTGWKLASGIDYSFPTNTPLPAGGTLVVVPFDPNNPLDAAKRANFLAAYGLASSASLRGPYVGRLDNGGETIRLQRPDSPPSDEPNFVPMLLEDEVRYDDAAPWPTAPDAGGPSLTRRNFASWGNDASSWNGDLPATPGTVAAASNTVWLTVVSDHGVAAPSQGLHAFATGSTVTGQVTSSEIDGDYRYLNSGWTLNGNEPATGAGSFLVTELTNNAQLTWTWITNFWFEVTSTPGGSVAATSGWYSEGATVPATATPDIDHLFVGWLGNTQAIVSGSVTSPSIQVNLAGPISLQAAFVSAFHTVTVVSVQGIPAPPNGPHVAAHGEVLSFQSSSSEGQDGTRYLNTGWSLAGHEPSSGSGNSVSFAVTNSAVLTWLWTTNYWLALDWIGPGAVTPSSGWHAAGALLGLSATPLASGAFSGWLGDTGAIVAGGPQSASITVSVTEALALEAQFATLAGSSNLLNNPSFEVQAASSANARHWTWNEPDTLGASSGTAARVNWRHYPENEGSWCGAIRGTWAGAGTRGSFWRKVAASPSLAYRAAAWFWAHDGTTQGAWTSTKQGLTLEFENASGQRIGAATNNLSGLREQWQERSVEATAPAGTVAVRFSVFAEGVGFTGAMHVDQTDLRALDAIATPLLVEATFVPPQEIRLAWAGESQRTYTVSAAAPHPGAGFVALATNVPAALPLTVFTNHLDGGQGRAYRVEAEPAL